MWESLFDFVSMCIDCLFCLIVGGRMKAALQYAKIMSTGNDLFILPRLFVYPVFIFLRDTYDNWLYKLRNLIISIHPPTASFGVAAGFRCSSISFNCKNPFCVSADGRIQNQSMIKYLRREQNSDGTTFKLPFYSLVL